MEPTSVEAACNLLVKSRLLSGAEVRDLRQRWLTEANANHGDPLHFARWLVSRQQLTEYQAGLLLKGHVSNFFLNDYKLLDRLGTGRMAGVYRAMHKVGQIVAIKILPPSKVKDAEAFGRFQREARLAVKLKHPNVVRTFHGGVADGLYYIVMEYLDGETLEEVLQRRKMLPPVEAARLMHQALQGLQHIHEHGMVHRDLKPANLMLVPALAAGQADTTEQATVKILDIGLGRALFEEGGVSADQMHLTTEATVLGTPEYMAPEQARSAHGADIRADLYSLGCVFYHLLAGQPPFTDKNTVQIMIRHASHPPRPLPEINPTVPEALWYIVAQLLAKDPAQRFSTPEQAARAVQGYLQSSAAAVRAVEGPALVASYVEWVETSADIELPAVASDAPEPEPADQVEQLDVELIPVQPSLAKRLATILAERGPSRRQWLIGSLSVAGALSAAGIGWLIAQKLRGGGTPNHATMTPE